VCVCFHKNEEIIAERRKSLLVSMKGSIGQGENALSASRQNTNFHKPDKVIWLAKQVFDAFQGEITGLKFYVLDCGCIYFQRVFEDGNLDLQVGTYRDAEQGACDICAMQAVNWREMVKEVVVVYNSKFEVDFNP